MKKLIILCVTLCFAVSSFAQKGKLNTAKTAFTTGDFPTAYKAITAASQHEKTMNNPETWAYKAQILSSIQTSPTVSEIIGINVTEEELIQALDKAIELDTEGKFKEELNSASTTIINNTHNRGVAAFSDQKDFAAASQIFKDKMALIEKYQPDAEVNVLDFVIIGASELELGNTAEGISYYEKVTELEFDDQGIYNTVIIHYQETGDDEKYLEALKRAQKVYPDVSNYKLMEIDYLVQNGQIDEALQDMLTASEKNPENANLMTTIASVYKTQEDVATERQWLQKAINVEPDHYESNFNLGVSYFNEAVKFNEEMNFMSSTTSPEYLEAKKQRDSLANKAIPFFEKSYSQKPTDPNVLLALVQYHRLKDDKATMDKFQAELDATGE